VLADDLGDLLQRVGHTRRGLVVRYEDGFQLGVRGEGVVDLRRVRGSPEVERELGRLPAVDVHDLEEALPEDADGHHQHLVAGRHVVHDRGFHPAAARSRQHQHVVRGLVDPLQPLGHSAEDLSELGSAVVDHFGSTGFGNLPRNGGRAGNTQIHVVSLKRGLRGSFQTAIVWRVNSYGQRNALDTPRIEAVIECPLPDPQQGRG
jgi:hypothetical protein